MIKIKIAIGLKQTLLYTLLTQLNLKQPLALKVQYTLMYMLHIHKIQITQVFHVMKSFPMLRLFVVNLTHFILHNTLTSL